MLCSLSVLHSPEHTDSQSWVEKRRGREEIEVTWGRKRRVKRGESNLASNHFPICSPVWNTQRGSWSYIENRKGRKEIEETRRRGGGVKRRETNIASNQFPKCYPLPGAPKEIHRVK